MSLGKGGTESQSTTDVWSQQAPYLQDLYSQAQSFLPQAQQGNQGMMDAAQGAWQNALSPQTNPYLQQMGQTGLDQINRNLTQDILPAIGNEAMGGMNLGSSRHGIAEGLATQGAQIAGGDFLTNLYGGQYQGDQNRALGALAMTPSMQNMQWNPLQQYAGLLGGPVTTGQSASDSKRFGIGL